MAAFLLSSLLHLGSHFLSLLSSQPVLFSQELVDLEGVGEENDGGVVEEVGAGRVVITLEPDQIFVTRVRLMQLLTMVRLDEVILLSSGEKGWNEALFDVSDRRQFIQIEASLFLDGLLDEGHGGADEEFWHFGVRCGKFVAERPQV